MKVKLVYDQFRGRMEAIVDVPDDATEEDIHKLFPKELEVEYNEDCHIEMCPTVVKWLFKNGSYIIPVIEGENKRSPIHGWTGRFERMIQYDRVHKNSRHL